MPRSARIAPGGVIFHCLNRGNDRRELFADDADYAAFERVLVSALEAVPLRAHRHRDGRGHLYQGVYKSFPVEDDRHFLLAARYVERNALRASLVRRAEDWRWGSLWRRQSGSPQERGLLSEWPLARPADWLSWVNEPQSEKELAALRESLRRGRPFGGPSWQAETAARLKLQGTFRPPGRPKKAKDPQPGRKE